MAVLRFPMNISAVLLAGGESRRMGEDKATLLFRGKPLWQIHLELLRKLDPAEIFVSARTDPAWRPDDVQFVADDSPSRGPLSGLAASLNLMRGTHLLALAIDMPFMSESYVRSLCLEIEPRRGVLPNPFIEIGRTNRQAIIGQNRWHAHRSFATVGQAVEADPLPVCEGKLRQPFECALVLRDDDRKEALAQWIRLALEHPKIVLPAIRIVRRVDNKAQIRQARRVAAV